MKYDVILADPPWSYRAWSKKCNSKSAEHHYSTLPLERICAIPVDDIAARNCALFLWAVWPSLFEYVPAVLDAWGFSYRACAFVWLKTLKHGPGFRTGLGYYTRAASEPCLLAIRGRTPVADHSVNQVIYAPTTRHSAKPMEQYGKIERLFPGARKIELFARNRQPGWDVWGNEVESDIDLVVPDKDCCAKVAPSGDVTSG